jgi:hypothetical protein
LELLLLVHQWLGVLGLPPAELLAAWLSDTRSICLDAFARDALASLCLDAFARDALASLRLPQRLLRLSVHVELVPTCFEVRPAALAGGDSLLHALCTSRRLGSSGGVEAALRVAAALVSLLRLVHGRGADAVLLATWAHRYALGEFGGRGLRGGCCHQDRFGGCCH